MARILICDDAPFMRMVIREALEGAGHIVVAETDDLDDLVLLYKEQKPDLVTMDILMKESGVEGVRRIMKLDPKAKVIVISVLAEQEAEVIDAVRLGAQGIVTKPIKRELLVAEVLRVLNVKG